MEALSESESTKEEVDHQQQQQQQTNKITFGCSIDSLLKEIDLPNMRFQISGAMDGDISIFIWRHPRIVRRRVNFSSNIKLLVGFCIFASGILNVSIHHEPMNQEKRALLIIMLFIGSLIFILLIEVSQLIPQRLAQEGRLLRLVGWLQEGIIILTFSTMVHWIFSIPLTTYGICT